MADLVRDQILDEVEESRFFSLSVDECKDVSKKQQISLTVRYYFRGTIQECFLEFQAAAGLDAETLAKSVILSFNAYGLDLSYLVGQAYDGASVMSGKHKGVQQRLRSEVKYAYYVHCCAHRLNLVLVDACKSVREAREFFSLLEKLYVFASGSLMHIRWLEVQRRLYPSEPPRQLQRLCNTRWACRATAC